MSAVPMILALAGLTLYTVLGGADFGAGMWLVLAGPGERGERVRNHCHRAMAPVWEANHVWLIFVLVVVWTCYPPAFEAIFSTLAAAIFLGAVGIVLRGAAYALRAGATSPRELGTIDGISAVSSVLVPFALGAAIGGIASGRVPPGNAAGHEFSSWLNPTSAVVGGLAVVAAAYLAAVYLAADARRLGDDELTEWFRRRALAAGVLAGAVAVAGLVVVHSDAPRLWHGLTHGAGLVVLIGALAAGAVALGAVLRRRFETARYAASVTVAGVVTAWALAQEPDILPGLTVAQAAASHDVLVLVTVGAAAGLVILLPSLTLLFRLTLGGAFERPPVAAAAAPRAAPPPSRGATRGAVATLIVGFGLLTVADAGWAHAIGVVSLLGFLILGVRALLPGALAD